MCGRYVTVSTVQTIESRFQVQAAPDVSAQWRPNANSATARPRRSSPVTARAPCRCSNLVSLPRWAKKQFYMINARSEGDHNKEDRPEYTGAMGILQKPMFRQSIRDRRRIVIADAFIEGPRQEKLTKPYLVYARHGRRPFGLAGIWDEWANPATGEITRSFAILTTVANELMQAIGHHRSPIVLDEEQEQAWVDLSTPLSDITGMLRPCPAAKLNAYPISPDIRDPRARQRFRPAPTHRRPRLPGTRLRNPSGTGDVRHGRVRARNRQSSAPGTQGSLF